MKNLNKSLSVYARAWKEDFDEQYKECISIGGYDKIFLKKNAVISDKTNLSAFKTRSRIVHSPPNSTEVKKSQGSLKLAEGSEEQESSKINDNLVDEKAGEEEPFEEEELKCDMVLGQKNPDKALFDLMKPHVDSLQGANCTALIMNIFRNLINFELRESKESEPTLFNMILNHLFSLSHSEKRSIHFSFSALQANGRFEDLLAVEDKKTSKKKEKTRLSKKEVNSTQELYAIFNRNRIQIMNKKPLALLYSFSLKSHQKKSKLLIFDLLSLCEKGNQAVADPRSYNPIAKLISALFTFQPEEQGLGFPDPMLKLIRKSLVEHVEKPIFLCNFRNALPFYNQNQQLIRFMQPIIDKGFLLDSLFLTVSSEVQRKIRESGNKKVDAETKKMQELVSKLQEKEDHYKQEIAQLSQNLQIAVRDKSQLEEEKKRLSENNAALRQKLAKMAKANQSSEDLAFMFENSIISEPLSHSSVKSLSKVKENLPLIYSSENKIAKGGLNSSQINMTIRTLKDENEQLQNELLRHRKLEGKFRNAMTTMCQKMQIKSDSDSDTIKTLSEFICKFMLMTSTFETKENELKEKIQALENDLHKERQEHNSLARLCHEKICKINQEYAEDMDKAKKVIERYSSLFSMLNPGPAE